MTTTTMTTTPSPHLADFRRVTEHGSEFFRVTCRETRATAMHWPSYLRDGHPMTVTETTGEASCFDGHEHVNATKSRKSRTFRGIVIEYSPESIARLPEKP